MVPESEFVRTALGSLAKVWNSAHLHHVASSQVPDRIFGRRRELLKADANQLWAQWFAEGIADPRRYVNVTYVHLFSDVLSTIRMNFGEYTTPEQIEIAKAVAMYVNQRTGVLRNMRSRSTLSRETRALLIDVMEIPRCWICGSPFRAEAIENFRDGSKHTIPLPPFVDVFKPIGLVEQDLRIEVDHVRPFSGGGAEDENLRLACGWCNRFKSSLESIYEVSGTPRRPAATMLGLGSLPQPFWVIRLLAAVRRCEHRDGCENSSDSTEMTVAPIQENGAMNPRNLRITCSVHDPIRSRRLQPRDQARSLWARPTSGA